MWGNKNESVELLKILKIVIHAMNGFHTKECLNRVKGREERL